MTREERIEIRGRMIEALRRMSREAELFAAVLDRQQDGDRDPGSPGLDITTYWGTMQGYQDRYEILCRELYRKRGDRGWE